MKNKKTNEKYNKNLFKNKLLNKKNQLKISIASSDLFNYKLHFTVLLCTIIALLIGTLNITLIGNLHIVILPLVFAIILAMSTYIIKPITWIKDKQSNTASKIMLILIGTLIAKLAIASGQNIEIIINTGPLLLLEEIGDIGAIIIGLPLALLLGFKRECIGMTSSICREPQMAVLIDKYGFSSVELKGFMTVYLIGTVFGTIIISIIATIIAYVLPLHPFAYAMACGIGSTSMNVAAISSLSTIYPSSITEQLYAFSGISNLISIVFSVYVYLIISLPLTERLYKILEPILGKFRLFK